MLHHRNLNGPVQLVLQRGAHHLTVSLFHPFHLLHVPLCYVISRKILLRDAGVVVVVLQRQAKHTRKTKVTSITIACVTISWFRFYSFIIQCYPCQHVFVCTSNRTQQEIWYHIRYSCMITIFTPYYLISPILEYLTMTISSKKETSFLV